MNNNKYLSPTHSKTFYNNIGEIFCEVPFVKKGKDEISNIPCAFDIETTSFYKGEEKQAIMYAWGFGINGRCIYGRTWKEFLDMLDKLKKVYVLNEKRRLVIYIHNLSYEFQFFKDYFEWEKVFALDNRKPLYAITKCGIEFRCSYLLSGYSLEKLGENLIKYKVKKKVGDLDYNLIRHSETPLTEKDLGYLLNDCLIVMAHIQEEIERLGGLHKIPLTKTGYVRELCRNRCLQGDNRFAYARLMRELRLDCDSYKQLKRAYSGGFTHANAYNVDKVVYNVHSFDFTSSYPSVMISEKYPMSLPISLTPKNEKDFVEMLNNYCCMFDCRFTNIRSIVDYDNYISVSRCANLQHFIANNGRIIEASSLEITITEQDFFIIAEMYDWDNIEIANLKGYYKDYLPKDFILTILELYKNKTELKGIVGKEVEYMLSKNMINSCYGMCVTDPCRDENTYENGHWLQNKADIEKQISKYNKNGKRTLYYAWGVWVTAYARRNLFTGIREFGSDYIYSDTDSIKVRNIEKHRNYINEYNKNIQEKIVKCLKHYNIDTKLANPKTKNGKEKPLGVWEYEGEYSRFKTLGAKRYIVEKDGDIEITIAGVSKTEGRKYLKAICENNDNIFDKFREDLHFPSIYIKDGIELNGSGKMLHTYIDINMQGEVIDYLGNKYEYFESSGIHLENTDYTMSLDEEFKRLILGIKGEHIC